MRILAAALAMGLALGCGGADSDALGRRSPPASDPHPERETIEIGLEHLRPAFTRDTVIRLNAIVARSLETIREYDGEIVGLRQAVDSALVDGATPDAHTEAIASLERLGAFEERAKRALHDMRGAVGQLEASGERYNEAILAGMVDFVEDVESELHHERQQLSERLAGRFDEEAS